VNGHPSWAATLLPLAILVVIMLVRMRNLARARPLRGWPMVVLPAIYTALIAVMFAALPPSATGWLCFAGGVVVGAAIGWQRARLMRLHLDPDTRQVMIRQSPAGLILLVVVAGLRRLVHPTGGTPGPGHPAMPASALLFTDALVGFALGMIVAQRVELWRRSRALRR
jgi:hypothetical protein